MAESINDNVKSLQIIIENITSFVNICVTYGEKA